MSRETVELVQGVIEAQDRRDFEALFAAYDPEIEWNVARVPAPGFDPVYHGHEGVRAFWRGWFAAWEIASFEYEELIDAGDSVIAVLSQRMRGRTSGIEVEWSGAQVWTVADDKVVRVEFFPTPDEAIEAVQAPE